jgi:2-polyprenyl-3-methyl-5-hydroxy-6-metoxy-1,4-benzoquinol methylase
MQYSKLEDHYSLSSKISCKEMWSKVGNYQAIAISRDQELIKYMDQYTQRAKSNIVIIRDKCPLCDSKDFRFLFLKQGFDHMGCNNCDLIFTLQIIDENKLKYMDTGKEGDLYGDLKKDTTLGDFDRQKFEIVFEELTKYSPIKNIFDFGSQLGSFLDWASKEYSIIGHEYHAPLREIAQSKGHTVLSDNLGTMNLDGEFDLITCWDYLDHVTNPKETIGNLSKYLKKGGIFFFAINNRDSLSARVMHGDSPMFIGPHHTMHYGIKQLKLLMKDYEFLYSYSYVSELNWISNWLNFKNPEFGDSQLLFELFDPKKITQLGMGIKVNAAFRKI